MRDEGELRVLLRREIRVLVILLKNCSYMLLLFWRVERAGWNVVHLNGFVVHLPRNQKHFAESVQPRTFPRHEADRSTLARQRRVPRRQRLKFMQGDGVADGPRQ